MVTFIASFKQNYHSLNPKDTYSNSQIKYHNLYKKLSGNAYSLGSVKRFNKISMILAFSFTHSIIIEDFDFFCVYCLLSEVDNYVFFMCSQKFILPPNCILVVEMTIVVSTSQRICPKKQRPLGMIILIPTVNVNFNVTAT